MCRRPSGPRFNPQQTPCTTSSNLQIVHQSESAVPDVLPGPRPQVAPAAVRRRRRPAGGDADAAQRARERPARAGVRVRRAARRRQDDDGAHPGAGAELREGTDRRSVRRRATPASRSPKGATSTCSRSTPPRTRGVDNVREVIIAGLGDRAGPRPLQGLHHRRGPPALGAVVQRAAQVDRGAAAARRLHDGDDRARQDSRTRSCRARRCSSSGRSARKAIADQLRTIADAERIAVGDESLLLIARDADGSMRDAQSKLDQVIAFTGNDDHAPTTWRRCSGWSAATCCSTSLEAVADEDAAGGVRAGRPRRRDGLRPAAGLPRAVARRARPAGARRSIPSRDRRSGDRRRGRARAAEGAGRAVLARGPAARVRLLTRAEHEIRDAAQPRYHLEMALLRWIHLRKLVPLDGADRRARAGSAAPASRGPAAAERSGASAPAQAAPRASRRAAETPPRTVETPHAAARRRCRPRRLSAPKPVSAERRRRSRTRFLAEIRKPKAVFYNTVVAQAQTIDVAGDRIDVHVLAGAARAARAARAEPAVARVARRSKLPGRRMSVVGRPAGRPRRPAPKRPTGRRGARSRPTCEPKRCRRSACRRCSTCSRPRSRRCSRSLPPRRSRDVEEMRTR